MNPKTSERNEQEPREGEIVLYTTPSGVAIVEVFFQDETFWLTQKRMADLFGVDVRTISEHLQGIFRSGELNEQSVIRKIRSTAADGKAYLTSFYHLDATIAVGYRVNSYQATLDAFLQFNEYDILKNAGAVSHEVAKRLAEEQYERFRVIQDRDYESDFEKQVKKITPKKRRGKDAK